METLQEIIKRDNPEEIRALFAFDKANGIKEILVKFNLWSRRICPEYFESEDAKFHEDINFNNLRAYLGEIDSFVDIAFRGAGKDVKTKLFIIFCILNDLEHRKRYFKILSEDDTNSKQVVTDIYNKLVSLEVNRYYPSVFGKSVFKREEKMNSFTTSSGVKVIAGTVGTEQRGAIQEEIRPDFIWFNDFESRNTLKSAIKTITIRNNMEEARTSLQKGGCCIYTCNYISEAGNVHLLVTDKQSERKVIKIIPIIDNGVSSWDRYTLKDIENMKRDDDDFEGEKLCKPNASKDIYFNRDNLEAMVVKQPIKEISGFKIFKDYNPGHRYAGGHDVAGGVGLDSSASVFIDFDTIPAQVVGTFHSNTVAPEAFGDEVYSEGNRFGGCLLGIENNKFDQTILKAKQLGANLFMQQPKAIKSTFNLPNIYGWNTNSLTKSKMLSDLREAIESGLIELNDEDLIAEAKSYTRNDLIDTEPDIRLSTRHFDLLVACCIAWQMKNWARIKKQPINNNSIWQKQETNPAI